MSGATDRLKLERLAQKLFPRCKLLRTWELAGGSSAYMTALEALLPNGRTKRLVARRPGEGSAAREFHTLQAVHEAGIAAPAPLLLDTSGDLFAEPVMLIEFVEGEPDYAPADPARFVAQLAEQLAAIHRLRGANPNLAHLPQQAIRLSRQMSSRHCLPRRITRRRPPTPTLEATWPLPRSRQNQPCCTAISGRATSCGATDGSPASSTGKTREIGHPLGDLAIARLDLLWTCGVEAMHAFTHRYQALTGEALHELPYWDLIAALRPAGRLVEWAAIWPKFGGKTSQWRRWRRDTDSTSPKRSRRWQRRG